MMGYSYSQPDGPEMCFNGGKSWQLGWYSSHHHTFNFSDGSWSGKLIGNIDMNSAINEKIILKLNTGTATDYYVSFNRKAGHNSGTIEGGNQVTIQRMGGEGNEYAPSWLESKLNAGGSHTIPNFEGSVPLTLTVGEINMSANPPYAQVTVLTTCTNDSECDDEIACNGVETCVSGTCVSGTPGESVALP